MISTLTKRITFWVFKLRRPKNDLNAWQTKQPFCLSFGVKKTVEKDLFTFAWQFKHTHWYSKSYFVRTFAENVSVLCNFCDKVFELRNRHYTVFASNRHVWVRLVLKWTTEGDSRKLIFHIAFESRFYSADNQGKWRQI